MHSLSGLNNDALLLERRNFFVEMVRTVTDPGAQFSRHHDPHFILAADINSGSSLQSTLRWISPLIPQHQRTIVNILLTNGMWELQQ